MNWIEWPEDYDKRSVNKLMRKVYDAMWEHRLVQMLDFGDAVNEPPFVVVMTHLNYVMSRADTVMTFSWLMTNTSRTFAIVGWQPPKRASVWRVQGYDKDSFASTQALLVELSLAFT